MQMPKQRGHSDMHVQSSVHKRAHVKATHTCGICPHTLAEDACSADIRTHTHTQSPVSSGILSSASSLSSLSLRLPFAVVTFCVCASFFFSSFTVNWISIIVRDSEEKETNVIVRFQLALSIVQHHDVVSEMEDNVQRKSTVYTGGNMSPLGYVNMVKNEIHDFTKKKLLK